MARTPTFSSSAEDAMNDPSKNLGCGIPVQLEIPKADKVGPAVITKNPNNHLGTSISHMLCLHAAAQSFDRSRLSPFGCFSVRILQKIESIFHLIGILFQCRFLPRAPCHPGICAANIRDPVSGGGGKRHTYPPLPPGL